MMSFFLYTCLTLISFISARSIPFDRSFINQDHEATKYSKLINSSFVNMFISLAIDEIVCSFQWFFLNMF